MDATTAAGLLEAALRRTGLSQAELARRAGLPRSVLNAYVRGRREPGADTLARILEAAGLELRVGERVRTPDPQRAARILEQVLDLAQSLPSRRRGGLRYPPFASRVA